MLTLEPALCTRVGRAPKGDDAEPRSRSAKGAEREERRGKRRPTPGSPRQPATMRLYRGTAGRGRSSTIGRKPAWHKRCPQRDRTRVTTLKGRRPGAPTDGGRAEDTRGRSHHRGRPRELKPRVERLPYTQAAVGPPAPLISTPPSGNRTNCGSGAPRTWSSETARALRLQDQRTACPYATAPTRTADERGIRRLSLTLDIRSHPPPRPSKPAYIEGRAAEDPVGTLARRLRKRDEAVELPLPLLRTRTRIADSPRQRCVKCSPGRQTLRLLVTRRVVARRRDLFEHHAEGEDELFVVY